ncbi:hypothetical protein [Crassaminicella indica]|uniref:Uncharacterized protein n=1 Tax=Crassaminicella indica TaxID=2855394 RepID=A0ABX8R8X1_9CLOT|nr:hypothetical protein [Crassaminicella indica]QXM05246.1 hypothetical protein KVH43_07525 [Crassaminicella indica]
MKHVDRTLKQLRNKIWIEKMLESIINAFCISSIGFFLCISGAHFFPIVYALKKSLVFILGVIILGIMIGFFKRPSIQETALLGDSLGFQERLLTYLEYKHEENVMIENFKEELASALAVFDLVKKYKIKLPTKRIIMSVLLFFLATGIYFIPSLSMEVANDQEAVHKELKEEAQKLAALKDKLEKSLEDKASISEEKEELFFILEETEEKLKNSFDYDEGAVNVMEAQKKIKNISSEKLGEELKSVAGVFEGLGQNGEAIKDAFASGEVEKAVKALSQQSFSQKEQKRIIENIEEMEKRLKSSEYMKKELLKNMKTALKEQPTGERISQAIENNKQNKEIKKMVEEAESKLTSMKERLLAKGDKGFNSVGGEEKAHDFANGENEDTRNGEISNQMGNERVLGEAADHSMKEANGVGGSNGTDFEYEELMGKEGTLERQASSRLWKNEQESSFLKASWQDEGKFISKESDHAVATNGENVSLDYLYRKFQKEGMEYIKKQEIPLSRKEMVLQYFNKLNGGLENGRVDD